jgi:hypothetical protein
MRGEDHERVAGLTFQERHLFILPFLLSWCRQVHRRLNTPGTSLLHEPVYEPAPVINDLTVQHHLGMLNSRDERPGRGHVDVDLLESDERYLARDTFDRPKEGLRVDSLAAKRAVDEPWSQ